MTNPIDPGRRSWLVHAGCVAMASPSAWAQSRAMPRIAWLSYTRADSPLRPLDAFRQGMRALGYEDGVNVRIDARWGDDSRERMNVLAAELIATQPDVIVTLGPAVFPFLRSGTTLPLAFVFSGDPVEGKLVDSLARPGRNPAGQGICDAGGGQWHRRRAPGAGAQARPGADGHPVAGHQRHR
ncbi:MAG: hypothetical protein KBF63_20545, partial [Rhodoferax sp.]|nr:hypothetical protein [Rhodoferax sp.]